MLKLKIILILAVAFIHLDSKLKAADGNYIRADVEDLGLNWKRSAWFGDFYDSTANWIYHDALGWLYPLDSNSSSTWLYHPKLQWLWTKREYFPWIYFHKTSTYLYFKNVSGETSFYDPTTKSWENLEGLYWNSGKIEDVKFAQYHGQPFFERVTRIASGTDKALFNPTINRSEENHHDATKGSLGDFTSYNSEQLNFTYSVKFFKGSVFLFAGDRGVFKYNQVDDSETSSDGRKSGRLESPASAKATNSWNPRAGELRLIADTNYEAAGVSKVFAGNGNGSRYGYEKTPFLGAYDGCIDKTGTGMFIASGVGGIKYWKFEDVAATDLTGNTSSIFKHIVRLDDFLFVGTQGYRQPEIGNVNKKRWDDWAEIKASGDPHIYPADIGAEGVKVYRITSGETPTLEEYVGNGHLSEGGGQLFTSVQVAVGGGGINSVKKGTNSGVETSITVPQIDYPPDATATLVVSGGSAYRADEDTEITGGKIVSIGLEFYNFDNANTAKTERHFRVNQNNVNTKTFDESVMDATSINSFGLGTAGELGEGELVIRGQDKPLMGYTMRDLCNAPSGISWIKQKGLDSYRLFNQQAKASTRPYFWPSATGYSIIKKDFNSLKIELSDVIAAMPSSLIDVKGEEIMGFFQGGVVINGKNFPHIINSKQGGCVQGFKNHQAGDWAPDSGGRNINYQWSYGAVDVAFDKKTSAVYVADSTEFTLNGAGPGYYNPCFSSVNGVMAAMDGLDLSAGLIVMTRE